MTIQPHRGKVLMKFEELGKFARQQELPSFAGMMEDLRRWSPILPRAFETRARVRKFLLSTAPLDVMRRRTMFGEGCGIIGREFRMMDLVSRMMFAREEPTIDKLSAKIRVKILEQHEAEETFRRRQHEAHEAYKRDQEENLRKLSGGLNRSY